MKKMEIICYNLLLKKISMIDRINRELDILAAEKKRLQKLSQKITLVSPLFNSYVSAVRTVSILAHNLTESFTELLTPEQIKQLSKTNVDIIEQLLSMLSSSQTTIAKMKTEKQQAANKSKSQNCSICGENIHESNIKQALISLEEESRHNFHVAMEQFKKIAEEPIYTKEENNDFQERLHYMLTQREKILNTNCNRIEEFVEIMDFTLADLNKLKDVEFLKEEMSTQNSDFITASKIGEDVSKFLQQSFSKKIPAWIHKMFLRMMTSYIEESSSKKMEKAIQATQSQYIESKDVREIIREKQALQKQNKQISDELKQLKLCYKKLEEINTEYSGVIASLNRSIKLRQLTLSKQPSAKSRRNSKNITKIIRQDASPRQTTSNVEEEESAINYSIFENNDESFQNNRFQLSKRRKKQVYTILPQIKKNRFDNRSAKLSDNDSTAKKKEENQQNREIREEIAITQNINLLEEQAEDKQLKKEVNKIQQSKVTQAKKNTKSLTKQKLKIKTQKLNRQPESETQIDRSGPNEKLREKKGQLNQQNKQKGTKKIIDASKINNPKLSSKKNKTTKLAKVNLSKLSNENTAQISQIRDDQDSGIRQLYQYVANIKLNKKPKKQGEIIDGKLDPGSKRNSQQRQALQQNKENDETLESYNRRKNSKELMILKKISQDLTGQVMNKRSSLYSLISGASQNQRLRTSKKTAEISGVEEMVEQSKRKVIEEMNEAGEQDEREQYDGQDEEQYQEEFELDSENKERISLNQNEQKQKPFTRLLKLRNSENTYLVKRQKSKQFLNGAKNLQRVNHSLTNLTESKEAQRKIFDLLKNLNVIQKTVDYNAFSLALEKLDDKASITEHNLNSKQQSKGQAEQKKPSIFQEAQEGFEDQAHNSVYGRLFFTKAVAYKYEQSMAKSYHKKILKQLDQTQHNYCNEMYRSLCETKKIRRQIYQEFCSILRYPFQTLYNNFETVNFMSEMSFQTFEYFFRKIVWIHRKCKKSKESGVCTHIQSVKEQLLSLINRKQL